MILLRIVVGLLFVGHGLQKLAGWFGGHGIEGTGGFFESLGYRPGRPHATLAGVAEAGGGALFAVGFLTPLAALAITAVMMNAIATVHARNGVWVSDGGFEYNVVLIVASLVPVFAGPGDWSIDAALGWDLAGIGWAVATFAVALAVSGLLLAGRRRQAAEAPAEARARRAA